jgi:hypothetical protein
MKSRILILIFALTFAFSVQAEIRNTDISLDIFPENPSPNQNINATLNSYSIDLNKADIIWSVNSKIIKEAVGGKTFSFNAEALGSSTLLEAHIRTSDGQNILKNMTISPTELDLLWEAYDSYTPPFYKGKAMVSEEGTFKVVAMPNMNTERGKTTVGNLSYDWILDNTPQQIESGWGKNYLLVKNSYLDNGNTAEVAVSDAFSSANTSGLINLKTSKPKIIFYKNNPRQGTIYEQAINDTYNMSESGAILVAEPYFFSIKNINSKEFEFNWFLNNTQTQTQNPKNFLSIRPTNGQKGSAKIKVNINNSKTLFQSLEKELNIIF